MSFCPDIRYMLMERNKAAFVVMVYCPKIGDTRQPLDTMTLMIENLKDSSTNS